MGTTERYARHIALKEIGEEGQKKINHAQVLVIGAGGLGSPVLLYLAAAGVGTIGIMDDDYVSESNLQRQILYDTQCLGEPKAAAAARKLSALNPGCTLHPMPFRLTRENAQATVAQYDIVVDATDNLETRYLSICEFTGQVSVFNYQGGATYRDLYPYHEGIHDFSQPLGVIGALPGVVGSIQAAETLKIILGSPDTLSGRLLLIDLLKGTFRTLQIPTLER